MNTVSTLRSNIARSILGVGGSFVIALGVMGTTPRAESVLKNQLSGNSYNRWQLKEIKSSGRDLTHTGFDKDGQLALRSDAPLGESILAFSPNQTRAAVRFAHARPLGAEQGVVKWFNDSKGYGFIVRARGADIFVHHASILAEGFRTLSEGDRVTFDVVEGPKGLQAKNVVKIS